jgi:hypothetical protein
MAICLWDTLEFVYGLEVTAWDVSTGLLITITAAHNRLFRAHKQGWLRRRKIDGVYRYSWSYKAWDFFDKYGSFTDGNPWYRCGAMKKPLYYPSIVPW